MDRPIARAAIVLAACVLAWQPSSAAAQEQDTQFWLNAAATGDLDEATTLTLDGSLRWREEQRGGEQQTLRVTVLREIADGVRIGGGGGLFETQGGSTELRPHQEIDLAFGDFSARTRLEERFFDGADRMELRFRQRVGYAERLGGTWKLSAEGEYLHLLQTRMRGSASPRNEWRARAILSARASETLTLGVGYLGIFTPREGARDRITHVPQAHINWSF
jgi:hypothetical protein